MPEEPSVSFISHFRRGFTANQTGEQHELEFSLELDEHGAVPAGTFSLISPKDIFGIEESMVARIFPAANCLDLKYDSFPFLEFKDPDFLWRYSQNKPNGNGTLDPWLMLLVVKKGEYDLEEVRSAGLPVPLKRLKLRTGTLDDLENIKLCAWAHVQLTNYIPEIEGLPENLLLDGSQSARVFSRLICPVLLDKDTAYSAFVLPAVKEGWHKDEMIEGYPVYYSWDFCTGQDPSFESLFARIKFRKLDIKPFQVNGPELIDFAVDPANDPQPRDKIFELCGALVPDASEAPSLTPADMKEPMKVLYQLYSTNEKQGLIKKWCPLCKREIQDDSLEADCPGQPENPHPPKKMKVLDPYIGYPIYGSYQNALPKLTQDELKDPSWMYELNLSSPARIAAGLGAEVIRRNQENFATICWNFMNSQRARQNEESREREIKEQIGELVNRGIGRRFFLPEADKVIDPEINELIVRTHLAFAPDDVDVSKPIDSTKLQLGTLSNGFRRIMHQKVTFFEGKLHDFSNTDYTAFLNRRLGAPQKTVPDVKLMRQYKFEGAADDLIHSLQGMPFKEKLENKLLVGKQLRKSKQVYTPIIPDPMYEYLADLAFHFFIPGYDSIPNNTITLWKTNTKFLEGFMAGLNHEMMRELLWRGFPVLPGSTFFQRFWDRGTPKTDIDIGEIGKWSGGLGSHMNQELTIGGHTVYPVRTILLIKADLIKQYHDISVRLVKVDQDHTPNENEWNEFVKNNGTSPAGFTETPVLFHLPIGNDTLLIGSSLDPDSIKDKPSEKQYIVCMEQPSLPVFGLPMKDDSDQKPRKETIHMNELKRHHFETQKVCGCNWVKAKKTEITVVRGSDKSKEEPIEPLSYSALAASCFYQKPTCIIRAFSFK